MQSVNRHHNCPFIQAHEKLLIERDWGKQGTEITSVDGPMSLDGAKEEFSQDGREVRAWRFDPAISNAEDVSEDLQPVEDAEPDHSWLAHVKSCKSTSLYI